MIDSSSKIQDYQFTTNVLEEIAIRLNLPNWEQPNQQRQTEWSLPTATNISRETIITHDIKKGMSIMVKATKERCMKSYN